MKFLTHCFYFYLFKNIFIFLAKYKQLAIAYSESNILEEDFRLVKIKLLEFFRFVFSSSFSTPVLVFLKKY